MGDLTIEDVIRFDDDYLETEEISETPPFLGFFVGDASGKPLMTVEVYEGVFDLFLRREGEGPRDFELIPMLINALETFTSEINLQNLSIRNQA